MIGRFLEISVHCSDVLASIQYYESLGFRQLDTGEVWSHPYAVVTDGRIHIGLHAYEFDAPALTFVLPDLAKKLPHLERGGLHFAFSRTGDDEFNEAGFRAPDGPMVALLEARTYSPPAFDDHDFSVLGRYAELSLPVRDVEQASQFWEHLGFRIAAIEEEPHQRALLSGEDLVVGLHERKVLRSPTLTYHSSDLPHVLQKLSEEGLSLAVDDPQHIEPHVGVALKPHDSLQIVVTTAQHLTIERADA